MVQLTEKEIEELAEESVKNLVAEVAIRSKLGKSRWDEPDHRPGLKPRKFDRLAYKHWKCFL